MNVLEFVQAGGHVRLLGQPLEERLTPRQLRFLFATGAFAAGKAAARAVTGVKGPGEAVKAMTSGPSRMRFTNPTARAAAKQAMSQHLKAFKEIKRLRVGQVNIMAAAGVMPKSKKGRPFPGEAKARPDALMFARMTGRADARYLGRSAR